MLRSGAHLQIVFDQSDDTFQVVAGAPRKRLQGEYRNVQ